MLIYILGIFFQRLGGAMHPPPPQPLGSLDLSYNVLDLNRLLKLDKVHKIILSLPKKGKCSLGILIKFIIYFKPLEFVKKKMTQCSRDPLRQIKLMGYKQSREVELGAENSWS